MDLERALFDAGVFVGALLSGDPRHDEARELVEQARGGTLPACTTSGILSEVYAALTWERALPPHDPDAAADAVRAIIEPPSAIQVVGSSIESTLLMLQLASAHGLRARRVHDARHAADALYAGVRTVYTYDPDDWRVFAADGIRIVGPASVVQRLAED